MRTWADDLRRLCDALGLVKPVVLGSSFGGHVALAYAGLYPGHPGGIILANTTGGRSDHQRSVEVFRRLGGDGAAAVAERDFADPTEESLADFRRVCHPLNSKPGDAEELRQRRARSIQTTDVNRYYFRNEASRFDPWSVLGMIKSPVLILAGAKTTLSARYRSPRTSLAGFPLTPPALCACPAHVTPSSVTGRISPFLSPDLGRPT